MPSAWLASTTLIPTTVPCIASSAASSAGAVRVPVDIVSGQLNQRSSHPANKRCNPLNYSRREHSCECNGPVISTALLLLLLLATLRRG
jgi:hypothetical protein